MRIVLVLALALAGCRDEELARLSAIRDEVCACKTASCGEEAMKRVDDTRAEPGEPRKLDANHRAQEIARTMMDCMAKLYLQDRPTTDPDVPAQGDEPTTPESSAPASAGKP